MMSDHGQTLPDYQQSDKLLKCSLDLIIGVWLSSTNVTTLVQPKLQVVSSCIIGMPRSRKRNLAVQAYGSGDVVVPCFSFDDATTVAELVEVVLQHVRMEQPDVMVDKLIFGNNKEVVFNGDETSGRIVNYGIADNAIGFVILTTSEKMLAKRELSTKYAMFAKTRHNDLIFVLCILVRQWTGRPTLTFGTLTMVDIAYGMPLTGSGISNFV